MFRLHAILHDAAGATRTNSGKSLGFCYMIGWGSNSCLLGHVTGLLFCLYVKLFLLSVFKSVHFWSSISFEAECCIVLDIELADKSVSKELGVFKDGIVQGYWFRPPKMYQPTKQGVWCRRKLQRVVWNSGCLDYSELPNIFHSDVKGEHFATRTETCKFLASLMD